MRNEEGLRVALQRVYAGDAITLRVNRAGDVLHMALVMGAKGHSLEQVLAVAANKTEAPDPSLLAQLQSGAPDIQLQLAPAASTRRGKKKGKGRPRSPRAGATGGLNGGALVSAVATGGPAHTSGLRKGDVILTVDDEPLSSPEALHALARAVGGGGVLLLVVARRGRLLRDLPLAVGVEGE